MHDKLCKQCTLIDIDKSSRDNHGPRAGQPSHVLINGEGKSKGQMAINEQNKWSSNMLHAVYKTHTVHQIFFSNRMSENNAEDAVICCD